MAWDGEGLIRAEKQMTEENDLNTPFYTHIRNLQYIILAAIVILILAYICYKKVLVPFNYEQGLTDESCDTSLNTSKGNNIRRDLARLSTTLRRNGTRIPPPYPNGWFGIIESDQLRVGEVQKVDCLVPKEVSVRVWYVCEVDQMVFVWFHSDGGPPQWYLPQIEQINDKRWQYMGRNDFLISCHIQDIRENGADIAHLNLIHSDHLLAGKTLPTTEAWNGLGKHLWDGYWSSTETCQHEAVINLKHELRILDKLSLLRIDVAAKLIGPSYVQVLVNHQHFTVAILQTVTPISPLVQRVIHRLYAPIFFKPFANLFMLSETVMFQRDVMIWNSKEYLNNPFLVKTDRCVKAFRAWYKQFYSENSLSFDDAVKRIGGNSIMDW